MLASCSDKEERLPTRGSGKRDVTISAQLKKLEGEEKWLGVEGDQRKESTRLAARKRLGCDL